MVSKEKRERILTMKANYMTHQANGLGPSDIASLYSISVKTVHKYLQDIADVNHVTRDSLLISPHTISEKGHQALIENGHRPKNRKRKPIINTAPKQECICDEPQTTAPSDTPSKDTTSATSNVFDPLKIYIERQRSMHVITDRIKQSAYDRKRLIYRWEERRL